MEKSVKPLDIYIKRKRVLTAFAGVLWAMAAAGLCVLVFAFLRPIAKDDDGYTVVAVGAVIFSFVMLIVSILCFRNLFFEFVITADENGVNDHSGFIHMGHIAWDEIERITCGNGNKVMDALDILDGEGKCVRLHIKDIKQFTCKRSVAKKIGFFFGYSTVNLKSFCSTVNKREIYATLTEMHKYYTACGSSAPNGEIDG